MGIFRSTKGVFSRLVDLRVDQWISLDYLKETTGHFQSIISDIAVPKRARYSETFEEAMDRLGLTEKDLLDRKKEFTQLFYFFIVLSFLIITYGLYLAYQSHFIASLIAFCLSLYAFTQAFRFHFWLFQVKHRKLGCTLKEWFDSSADIESSPQHPLVKKDEPTDKS